MKTSRKNSLIVLGMLGCFAVGTVVGPTVARAQSSAFAPSKFMCVNTLTTSNIAIESCRNAQMTCAIAYDNLPGGRPVQLECK